MSSDSGSKVVVAESSAEDIVQRKKVKRRSVWERFQEKLIQRRNAYIVTINLKLNMQILPVHYAI